MKKKRVLVIGDIMLDHYINVKSNKLSSEAPLVIFKYVDEYYSLGGASNVCKYLTSFDYEVDVIGVIGKDNYGKKVIDLFNENNINTNHLIKVDDYKTIVKTRYSSIDSKQIMRVDIEDVIDINKYVINEVNSINESYDLILVSDYRKGVITNETLDVIKEYAKTNNIKVLVDPKDAKVDYKDLFLIKPNRNEISLLVSDVNDKNIIEYKTKNNIDNLVLTLGDEGMKLFDKNNIVLSIPSHKCKVYDVTGAGDCVLAYLAFGILNDYSIEDSCKYANYAASKKVSKFGTSIVNKYEVLPYFNNKIISINDIEELSKFLKHDKKIVFTNGCFDIIHSGHINLLREAKALGDVLILGLNSDDSIKRLKGSDRPINNVDERINVLSALSFVDFIVVFDEDTPYELIKKIKPNVLVKGADYKNKLVVGRDIVESYGGKVELIDLTLGKSTTNIINKIKESHHE